MKLAEKLKTISFAQYALYASLFVVGIFHTYLSCILSIVLLVWLCLCMRKNGQLTLQVDMTLVAMIALVGGYAVTSLWAIDGGVAIFGFFKFLPMLLYTLVLMQKANSREDIINNIPYLITFMTLLSIACMYIPFLSTYFAVSGRLSGFVQYPNSLAIILLIAELLLITKDRPRIWDYLCISVLLFGILYTGSRTVFILAGLSNVVALLLNKNKTVRWIMLGCIGAGIILVLVYCLVTDSFGVISRYLNISLKQSTFVGRLLYTHDALPVVLRHPFGLGYMGYYFIQQSIQTGIYGIMFVHNDLLQILLDVGWIPFALFAAAVVMTLINRDTPLRYKLILVTFLLHAGFDFDLQYVAIFMMLLLFISPKPWKTVTLKKKKYAGSSLAVTALLTCLCLYFGTAQALTRFEQHEAATKFYGYNTLSDIELIRDATTISEAEEIADRILQRNTHVTVTYSAKARAAYAKGDFGTMINYKKKAIQTAPFSYAEYWDFGNMLVDGIKLYEKAGDTKSADICKKELLALSRALPAQEERLSRYGAAIDQQPIFNFPKKLREEIKALEGEN